MAGFLKTEENRRLAVSAGSAAVVYILLFLFFAVYFAVGRREPQSFGASAVLIYGVPMGELSQPRNLVGGHVISALVGVIAYHLFPDNVAFASALAVATAIAAMMATNTTHPPGGATALIAVVGGASVHELGWMYVLSPVLVGVLIMLAVAVIVNNFSSNKNRHYPKYWI